MKIKLTGYELDETARSKENVVNSVGQEIKKVIKLGAVRGGLSKEFEYNFKTNELVEFQFENGLVWVSEPKGIPSMLNQVRENRSVSNPSDVINIPSKIRVQQKNSRGLIEYLALKIIKIFTPKLTEPIGLLVPVIEKGMLPFEGLNFLTDDFRLIRYENKDQGKLDLDQPILLFIHGTFSKTTSSFGGLVDYKQGKTTPSDTWKNLRKKYQNNILAFDHKTLSKSPFENAIDLLKVLPNGIDLHLVTQSRGGLVGEVLVRCSNPEGAFMPEEISKLENLNKSALEKFKDTVKGLPKDVLKNLGQETGMTDFLMQTASKWRKADLETIAQLLIKINNIEWKKLDVNNLFEGVDETILAAFFVQIDIPNRHKTIAHLKTLNKLAEERNISVKNMVRVACPTDGTSLLGERIDTILNVILNVFRIVGGPAYLPLTTTISSLLNSVVQQRNNPRVFPGLEVMIKGSPLLDLLNNAHVEVDSNLHIIAGKTGGSGPLEMLFNFVADRYFPGDNDLVVDTDSMFEGVRRLNDVYYKFVEGSGISHGTYFSNSETQIAIFDALSVSKNNINRQFKKVNREGINRNVEFKLPQLQAGIDNYTAEDKSKEKAIVLIPGIMGSSLSVDKEKVWLNYLRISNGSLSKLEIDADNIEAKSVLRSAYKKIVDYFSSTHHVVVFPFDWRRSLTEATDQLKAKLEELKKTKTSIQIIAHSMGGLVVRGLMIGDENEKYWKELTEMPNFKVLLLGTPWKGSYHIPAVLMGQGTTINALAKLSFRQTKKELLAIFSKFPGIYELLPIEPNENHSLDKVEFWQELQNITYDDNWVVPTKNEINNYTTYRNRIQEFYESDFLAKSQFTDYVFYIAGKDKNTFETFDVEDQYQESYETPDNAKDAIKKSIRDPFAIKRMSVVFKGTPAGDGSVTWKSGIPKELDGNVYYAVNTKHGELANDKDIFQAYQEILENGSTEKLTKIQPTVVTQKTRSTPNSIPALPNTPSGLMRGILGLNQFDKYTSKKEKTRNPLTISVKNGHLKYAKYPVIIGHFKDDIITSAENVMDDLLDRALSERVELGVYPGEIGSSYIMLPSHENAMGTVIVGLGYPENFNPYKLRQTIEQGCISYLLDYVHACDYSGKKETGISTLLIGTNYLNISTSEALNAILEGVVHANQKIESINNNQKNKDLNVKYPIISELEFIEIYEDKAITAYHQLHNIEKGNNSYQIKLAKKINNTNGRRTYLPVAEDTSWWKRLTAQVRISERSNRRSLYFNTSSQAASVVERDLYTDEQIITKLLEENNKNTEWNKKLMKTIFNLIVPNDFKMIFRSQQNLLLLLDKETAWYPWELLHYDENATMPICVMSGMIRQLATSNDRRVIRPVRNNSALIIGDPLLYDKGPFQQLPAAKKEAELVNTMLSTSGFKTLPLIRANLTEILSDFFNDYKIIHIASHGEVEFKFNPDDPKEYAKTGLVLSDNIILTTAEIDKMDTTPELVFINSCFAGSINAQKEARSRSRYDLAANIGTQFIENGAKAVIIAGWAIDDAAAFRFAEVFYENMLAGQNFAYAVQMARRTCFDEFPNTNTWGAYQCYGDQYYRLVKNSRPSGQSLIFKDRKQILATLEDFINSAKSSRKRDNNLLAYLKDISQAIESSGLQSAYNLALEAEAYAEIEENDIALKKYDLLLTQAKADFTVSAWEQMLNLKARHYVDLFKSNELEEGAKKMDEIIEDIEYFNRKGKTSERYSILASAYRRKSLILVKKREKNQKKIAIKKMSQNYKAGYVLKIDQGEGNKIYPLTNWLISEKFVTNQLTKKEKSDFEKYIGATKDNSKAIYTLLDQKLNEIEHATKSEFWDVISNVNIYQCQILYCSIDQIEKVGNQIVKVYRKAWDMDGSFKQKSSEIAQMEFVAAGVIDLLQAATEQFDKLKKLIENNNSNKNKSVEDKIVDKEHLDAAKKLVRKYQALSKECKRLVTFFIELE